MVLTRKGEKMFGLIPVVLNRYAMKASGARFGDIYDIYFQNMICDIFIFDFIFKISLRMIFVAVEG